MPDNGARLPERESAPDRAPRDAPLRRASRRDRCIGRAAPDPRHDRLGAEPTFRLLSDALELDRSTLSRNLNLLQRRGLLKLGASLGPKPGLITLTAKGRDALTRAHARWIEAQRVLEAAVPGTTIDDGLQFLRKLRRAVR